MIQAQIKSVHSSVEQICRTNGIGQSVRLVVVTKNQPPEALRVLADCHVTDVAENRVQALAARYDLLPGTKHLIGHLQTNKVRTAVRFADLIQSVDSVHLAEELAHCCRMAQMRQDILVQVNIAREETKYGIFLEHLPELLSRIGQLPELRVLGLMAIMPVDTREDYYRKMYELYCNLSETVSDENICMKYLSMGMSKDFPLAVQYGANMIRVGSYIFQ